MKKLALLCSVAGCTFAVMPPTFAATPPTVANPICADNTAFYDPGNGQNIVVPPGYTVSVFKSGLNFPTGIAFRRARQGDHSEHGDNSDRFDDDSSKTNDGFEVFVLESGHGLPSRCNEQDSFGKGQFDPDNPFTPDILVFDQNGKQIGKPLAKPTAKGGLQAAGPAVDIGFENGLRGGRLFVTDSNQATHAAGQNNSSRIVTVDRPDRDRHAVHHRSADRRSSHRATRVQGRLDLLVTGLDHQQRRRRT